MPGISSRSSYPVSSCRRDIVFARIGARDISGDLFLPAGRSGDSDPVLLIHGGGWNALDRTSLEFMAPLFAARGHPVFNIDYRLLDEAPWPACADDCLAAARFLLAGGIREIGTPRRLILCGASAGGHLAMAAGLRVPRNRIAAIISLAGPSRLDWVADHPDPLGLSEGLMERFFGHPAESAGLDVREASPALSVGKNPPPLYCLHSTNDRLVPARHSETAVTAWRATGGMAELTVFAGDGELHGFWENDDRAAGRLRAEIPCFIDRVLSGGPASASPAFLLG